MIVSRWSFLACFHSIQLLVLRTTGRTFSRNPQTKALQIDIFRLVGIPWSASFQADAQEGPQTQRLAGVIVAVGVGVAFKQPAPGAVFPAGVGLFLPALEH